MANDLITISALVLLPMIPAFILFKALPSRAVVKGPLAGMNVSLGGAFGGYVALTVFVATYFATSMPHAGPVQWRIKGKLKVDEGDRPIVLVSMRPPELEVGEDNKFDFKIPIANPEEPPKLVFEANGYIKQAVELTGPDGKIGGEYEPRMYKDTNTIVLEKDVVLERKPARPAEVASVQLVGSGG
jgi:hypothetical protein